MPVLPMRQRILTALFCGFAGIAANFIHVEIFFNVDLIFGSVFVMLSILLAGPAAGVLTALIAGSATYALWNHPWALVILVAEAAFVGWLFARRGWDLLLADLLYWTVLGPPLVWMFYHLVLKAEPQTTVLIILKQGINGIVNTLLASLLHLALRARPRTGARTRPAFRPSVFLVLVSLVTFPALLFLAAFLRREVHQEEQLLASRSTQISEMAAGTLGLWLSDRQQAIASLAERVARPDRGPGDVQRAVETIRLAIPTLKRVGVLDARAIVTAYSPPTDDEGRPVVGRDFSDRPFIPILKRTLRPYVGDPVMGRVGKPNPIIPLVAPVLRNGSYDGYCIGVTDAALLRQLLDTFAWQGGALVTVLDRDHRVVATTRTDLPIMAAYPMPEGEARPLGKDTWQRIPLVRRGSSRMLRWRNSRIVHEGFLQPDIGWRVLVELPVAPLLDTLTRISILSLGTLFLLILGTVALAHALSRGFTASITQLEAATRAFPTLLGETPDPQLSLPTSGIHEMHQLAQRFGQMATALRVSFLELRGLNDTLEQRVTARTAELQTALDTIRTLHGIIPICASCKKIRDDRGAWNQLETYISQHTDAAFSHGICPDCAERFRAEAHRGDAEG